MHFRDGYLVSENNARAARRDDGVRKTPLENADADAVRVKHDQHESVVFHAPNIPNIRLMRLTGRDARSAEALAASALRRCLDFGALDESQALALAAPGAGLLEGALECIVASFCFREPSFLQSARDDKWGRFSRAAVSLRFALDGASPKKRSRATTTTVWKSTRTTRRTRRTRRRISSRFPRRPRSARRSARSRRSRPPRGRRRARSRRRCFRILILFLFLFLLRRRRCRARKKPRRETGFRVSALPNRSPRSPRSRARGGVAGRDAARRAERWRAHTARDGRLRSGGDSRRRERARRDARSFERKGSSRRFSRWHAAWSRRSRRRRRRRRRASARARLHL